MGLGAPVLAGFGDADNEALCHICWDGFFFFFFLFSPGVWGKGKDWLWVQAPSNCVLSPFSKRKSLIVTVIKQSSEDSGSGGQGGGELGFRVSLLPTGRMTLGMFLPHRQRQME